MRYHINCHNQSVRASCRMAVQCLVLCDVPRLDLRYHHSKDAVPGLDATAEQCLMKVSGPNVSFHIVALGLKMAVYSVAQCSTV